MPKTLHALTALHLLAHELVWANIFRINLHAQGLQLPHLAEVFRS